MNCQVAIRVLEIDRLCDIIEERELLRRGKKHAKNFEFYILFKCDYIRY